MAVVRLARRDQPAEDHRLAPSISRFSRNGICRLRIVAQPRLPIFASRNGRSTPSNPKEMPQAAARRVKKDSRDMPQVFGFAHVFIAKPLHTFARHALNLGRTNP